VAQEAEDVAARVVGARLGDDVDDAARSPPELRRVRVGHDLKLLHGLLRDGRARGVDGVVGVVRSVDLYERGAPALAADVDAGGRSGSDGAAVVAPDGRDREREIRRAALVDREVVNAHFLDRVGDRRARCFDHFGRRAGDGYGLAEAADFHRHVEVRALADGQRDGREQCSLEVRRLDDHFVIARREVGQLVKAFLVGGRRTRDIGRRIAGRDGRAGDDCALRVAHEAAQVGGVRLRLREGALRTEKSAETDERKTESGRKPPPRRKRTHVFYSP
jgi:hypothetical protein